MSPLVKPPHADPVTTVNLSFKVPALKENLDFLRELRMMAAKDGVSFSEIVRLALQEYHERHNPGNPQLVLGHWSENIPLPKTIREHNWKQVRQGGPEGSAWVCMDQNCKEAWFQL